MIRYSARKKGRYATSGKNSRFQLPVAAGLAILLVYLAWMGPNPGGQVVPTAGPRAGVTLQDARIEAVLHEVVRVVDGDTFIVMVDGSRERIRLIGIDAPEAAWAAAGAVRPAEIGSLEATSRLEELLLGKSVLLASDVSDRDTYGRLLRYAWLDTRTCVNILLVEEGLASALRIPPDTAMAEDLRQAQQQAREAGLGIWSGK